MCLQLPDHQQKFLRGSSGLNSEIDIINKHFITKKAF